MSDLTHRLIQLVAPVFRPYGRYLGGIFVRQLLMVAGGYALVAALRVASPGTSYPVWALVAALLVFDTCMVLFDGALTRFFAGNISLPLFRSLRVDTLARLLRMPMEWHGSRNTLELSGRLNNGAGRIVQTVEVLGRELLPALIRTSLSLVPLLWFSAMTAPLVLSGLVIFLWLTVVENRARDRFRVERNEQYARDSGFFTECVQNVQPLVQFGQAQRMLDQYDGLQRDIALKGASEIRLATVHGSRRNLLVSATRRCSQGLWLWQYQTGRLDAPTVMYLNFLTEELIGSFWSYAGVLERVFDGLEPARVLVRVTGDTPNIQDAPGAKELDVPAEVGIELRDVSFRYDSGTQVFRNFDLEVEPGTVVGIVGRSGIGKTTMQNLLSRMFDAQAGHIRVGGVPVRGWRLDQLRGLFAPVSQNGAVFFAGSSVLETIRFGRPDATTDEAIAAAKCACIHDEILAMPDAYQTKVGDGGVTLSKGQAQRLGLAQALVALENRKVLILDEFTSALDAQTEAKVIENIRPRLKGKTVIMIAHRLATVKRLADKIVVVDGGGVAEQGTHADLIKRGQRYAELVSLQTV